MWVSIYLTHRQPLGPPVAQKCLYRIDWLGQWWYKHVCTEWTSWACEKLTYPTSNLLVPPMVHCTLHFSREYSL